LTLKDFLTTKFCAKIGQSPDFWAILGYSSFLRRRFLHGYLEMRHPSRFKVPGKFPIIEQKTRKVEKHKSSILSQQLSHNFPYINFLISGVIVWIWNDGRNPCMTPYSGYIPQNNASATVVITGVVQSYQGPFFGLLLRPLFIDH